MTDKTPASPRCAVLIGPYLSGKTTLLEALLFAAGATHRKGKVTEGNTVGDSSPEARARQMSVEANFAHRVALAYSTTSDAGAGRSGRIPSGRGVFVPGPRRERLVGGLPHGAFLS